MAKTIQNEFKPHYASPPGDTLQEMMEWYKVTPTELARETGKTVQFINQLLFGQAAITPELALHLERLFKMSADFWMKREQSYRDALQRLAKQEPLEKHLDWIDNFPIEELIELDWIENWEDMPAEQVWEVLDFFEVPSPTEWSQIWERGAIAEFRVTSSCKSDPYALAAWLRKGELEAQEIDCEPYNEDRFRAALEEVRTLINEPPEDFLQKITNLCAPAGVAVTFVQTLSNLNVSGATRWLTPELALIQLSLPQESNEQLWFSFFHEAGHILLHDKRDIFLEYEGKEEAVEKEQEADQFAADFLIGAGIYQR